MSEDNGLPVYEHPSEEINLGKMITVSYDLREYAKSAQGNASANGDVAREAYARLMTPEVGIVVGHILEHIACEADVSLHHERCHVNNCLSCAGQLLTEKLLAAMKGEE